MLYMDVGGGDGIVCDSGAIDADARLVLLRAPDAVHFERLCLFALLLSWSNGGVSQLP